jgi:hypothetical protein
VIAHVEYGWCLRGDNPGALVFVEETNRLSKQSVEVSSRVAVFVQTNIEDEVVMIDSLEFPLEGFRTICDINTASNEKTGDQTPKLDVLADVGSREFEKSNLV